MSTQAESWLEAQMTDPEFRAEYVRELVRMHRESIERKDPVLARWCMRERARVDSSGSTGYSNVETMREPRRRITPLRNLPSAEVMRAAADQFWPHVRKARGKDDCWEWEGPTNRYDGTAVWLFSIRGVRYRIPAARASAILHRLPVSDSEDLVYRTCRSLTCTNPLHLAVGDHEDNVKARHDAGNTVRGEENGRAKLTEAIVAEIKLALRKGASGPDLARLYGVERRAVWGIANGRTWKHVEPKAE
jgi:hypothetical protein